MQIIGPASVKKTNLSQIQWKTVAVPNTKKNTAKIELIEVVQFEEKKKRVFSFILLELFSIPLHLLLRWICQVLFISFIVSFYSDWNKYYLNLDLNTKNHTTQTKSHKKDNKKNKKNNRCRGTCPQSHI